MSKCTNQSNLTWWQLSFIGVGCIIGTGYFLGSAIPIQRAGSSVLIAYLVAGMGTWMVFQALAKLTAHHPEKGSFRTYAKQAYGSWAGFSNGWVYWSAEMLIMGSQLTALALFAQFWFPAIPLWVFTAGFAGVGLLVILMGVQKVEQMENLFGIMKVAAIVMFVIIATAAMFGWLGAGAAAQPLPSPLTEILPHDGKGLWLALLFAFYGFGGIEVMGLMAQELKDPKDAPKSGNIMLLILTILYLLSFYLVLKLVPAGRINANESPFLTALKQYDLPWVPHVFNAILVIAGFSTMVASLYAVTTMLVALAEEGDAPKFFAKKGKWKVPLPAFGLTTLVVAASIAVAMLLPDKLFEYITTAAGLMLLYTWIFILASFYKLMSKSWWDRIQSIFALILILLAISGTFLDHVSRIGFLVSIAFIVLIAIATIVKEKRAKA
ncbi:amino acid permease [Rossellomorea aquimaris]|uniref:Amino acid/polyamine/organocation transporter (APC superfamily) n=1 Tax=Rossellomorea aquimaris TaxID=189382 RepID=A0A366ET05_9BACI|nr:amino acid permease [Rossellomorea aquimaris]RBP05531.1 amino acid/polyamine/organocation transporter (APC superfamily) [Rossellomorea aquimaris]